MRVALARDGAGETGWTGLASTVGGECVVEFYATMSGWGRVCIDRIPIVNVFIFQDPFHWGRSSRCGVDRSIRVLRVEREHMKYSTLSLALAGLMGVAAIAVVDDVMATN